MLTLVEAPGGSPPGAGREVNSWRDEAGRAVVRAFQGDGIAWIDYVGVGSFAFEPASPVVQLRRVPGIGDGVVEDVFGRVLTPLILQARGYEVLHASAVLVSEVVLAFVGHRHSGKSTLAHAMHRTGHQAFADDVVVLGFDTGAIAAHALPFSPRLRPSAQAHFQQADARLDLQTPMEDRRPSQVPLGAIVLLAQSRHAPETPFPARLEPAEAFKQVLAYAQCFDDQSVPARRRMVDHYLTIATTTPVFTLTYHPEFDQLAPLMTRLVTTVRDAWIDDRRTAPRVSV